MVVLGREKGEKEPSWTNRREVLQRRREGDKINTAEEIGKGKKHKKVNRSEEENEGTLHKSEVPRRGHTHTQIGEQGSQSV